MDYKFWFKFYNRLTKTEYDIKISVLGLKDQSEDNCDMNRTIVNWGRVTVSI